MTGDELQIIDAKSIATCAQVTSAATCRTCLSIVRFDSFAQIPMSRQQPADAIRQTVYLSFLNVPESLSSGLDVDCIRRYKAVAYAGHSVEPMLHAGPFFTWIRARQIGAL